MKVSDLRSAIDKLPEHLNSHEVKVWLPGSRISLGCIVGSGHNGIVLIEGNLDSGSALASSIDEREELSINWDAAHRMKAAGKN